jgi:AraC family transcriptional regulator
MDSKLPLSRFHEEPFKGLDVSGFQLRTNDVHGFRLIESAYPAGYELPKHSHEYGCFYVVLEGSLTERFGKKSRECEPMSMVFNRPGEEHSNSFQQTGGRCFLLEMYPDRLANLREHSLMLDQSAQFYGGLLAWLGIRAYKEFRRMDPVSPLVIESLGVEIMAEISRSAKGDERKPPVWLERTREFLHENFAESLSLSEVAEIAEVHPVHLVRVFRTFYRSAQSESMCAGSGSNLPLGNSPGLTCRWPPSLPAQVSLIRATCPEPSDNIQDCRPLNSALPFGCANLIHIRLTPFKTRTAAKG